MPESRNKLNFKGGAVSGAEISNRNNIGNTFPNQQQVLYGNRVTDILSYLPEDLLDRYDQFLKRQVTASSTDPKKSPSSLPKQFDGSGVDGYETYISSIRKEEIKLTQELAKNKKLNDRQRREQLQQVLGSRKQELLRGATVPLPTLTGELKDQFAESASRNTFYMIQLQKAIDELVRQFGNRLQTGQKYRNASTGQSSSLPWYRPLTATAQSIRGTLRNRTPLNYGVADVRQALEGAATILYQLIQSGLLRPNAELNIRPINIRTGQFETTQDEINQNKIARKLKLPLKGAFVVNGRVTNIENRSATFTGTDIEVSYALGYTVGKLKGLNTFTWSIHRGKPDVPRGDEVPATHRARGRRTIAGTMIFSQFDEHPLTAIYPVDFFPQDEDFQMNAPIRGQIMKPDQLPAFDLIVILTNEYGFASILSLYGVEIHDDSGGFNMNDLVNEEIIHYTAKDMDPLHTVKRQSDGTIDPFELTSLQSDALFRRRSQVLLGKEGNDHYARYDTYHSDNFKNR